MNAAMRKTLGTPVLKSTMSFRNHPELESRATVGYFRYSGYTNSYGLYYDTSGLVKGGSTDQQSIHALYGNAAEVKCREKQTEYKSQILSLIFNMIEDFVVGE